MNKLVSRNSIQKMQGGGGLLQNLFDLFTGRYEENLKKQTLQRINQTMDEAKKAGQKAAKDFDRGYSLASRKGFYLAPHPNSGNDTNFQNGIQTYNNLYRFKGKNKSKNIKQKSRQSEIEDVKAVQQKPLDLELLKAPIIPTPPTTPINQEVANLKLNVNIPQQTYDRTGIREFIRNKGIDPYSFNGAQRRALRMVLNNTANDNDKLLVKGMGLFKQGGQLISKSPIKRFKSNRINKN